MLEKNEKILLQWENKAQIKSSKAVIAIFVLLAISSLSSFYFIYSKDYISGIVFIFIAITLLWFLFANKPASKVIISDLGIYLNQDFYAFGNLKEFWFSTNDNYLYLKPIKNLLPIITVPVNNIESNKIKELFPKSITELPRGENVFEKLNQLFD